MAVPEWARRFAATDRDRAAGTWFPLIGAVAAASALLPPGPARPQWYVAALTAGAATTIAVRLTPRGRAPEALITAELVATAVSIGMLVVSVGSTTGLTPLMLLPMLASALYARRRQSAILVPTITSVIAVISVVNGVSPVVLGRVIVFWLCMLTVISAAVHGLRDRLQASAGSAAEVARQEAVLRNATRTLTVLRDPHLVLRASVRLAAELCSPPTDGGRRGQYLQLGGGFFTIAADSDESGPTPAMEPVPVAQHPIVAHAVATKTPQSVTLDLSEFGPIARAQVESLGVTHGAYVPVVHAGAVHGLLVASGRGQAVTPEMYTRLIAIAGLTEVSLELATAHSQLAEEAGTDPLTGLANRREFDRTVARMSRRQPFAVLAIDVDDLKTVNDTHGHAAGDELIRSVAAAMASVMRKGDTLARIGGDEFAILALDTGSQGAWLLAQRITAAVAAVELASGPVTVSIGVRAAPPGADPLRTLQDADVNLYAVKRSRTADAAGLPAALVGGAQPA